MIKDQLNEQQTINERLAEKPKEAPTKPEKKDEPAKTRKPRV